MSSLPILINDSGRSLAGSAASTGAEEDRSESSSASAQATDARVGSAFDDASDAPADFNTDDFDPRELSLAGRVTPPPQPKEPLKYHATPEATRQAATLVQQNLFNSPDKTGKAAVTRGLTVLQTIHEREEEDGEDPDEGFAIKKAQKIANEIVHSISPGHDPATVRFHDEASQKLERKNGLSNTSKGFFNGLAGIGGSPQRVIPIRHLSHFDPLKGGFHVDLDDSHQVNLIAINPRTGVRYALIDGIKISTMFPAGVGLDHIVAITRSAEVIAKRDNQSLRMTQDGYVIECYANSPISFSSLFPVFLFETFVPERRFELIDGFSIDSQQALDAAKRQIVVVEPYKIKDDQERITSIIVDIAPVFKDATKIEKGIFFQFDRASAPDLFLSKRKRMDFS